MGDAGLKTKQTYMTPAIDNIKDPEVKMYAEELGRVLFRAFRDIYDDVKLLLVRQARAQTPAKTLTQITANQNNYDIGDRALLRMSSDASRNVTGLQPVFDGKRVTILNIGSFDIVLKHQDANSTAANRMLSQTGADVTLAADEFGELIYDSTTERWRI